MNVLLTCAGRRNYLVQYFRSVLCGSGRVLATDMTADAPAMREADEAFLAPAVSDPGYVDAVLAICRAQDVELVVSLNDLELPILADARERFLEIGAVPVVSSPAVIDICFDKWSTVRFLEANGLRSPRTFLSLHAAREALSQGKLSFPLVLKPRWGTASIGIEIVHDAETMGLAYELLTRRLPSTIIGKAGAEDQARQILIQECLTGPEHGLDVVNDLDGNHVTTWCRRKISMRAGETDKAVTVDSPALMEVGAIIGSRLGHRGNLDCDVFVTDAGPYVLELNPRFGGGYPFSHAAGANLPAALVAWRRGEQPTPESLSLTPGIQSAKCDRLITWNTATE